MKLKAWCGPSFFVFQQIQKKDGIKHE